MPDLWDLVLTLPNLAPPKPTPFDRDGYVICAGDDSRLRNLADTPGNTTARRMLRRFRTARQERYIPACFLIRADITIETRDREAIRAFRNLCAISTTTATHALALEKPHAVQWRVVWSDQFLFGYFTPARDGFVGSLDGASRIIDNAIPHVQPDAQFGNPHSWTLLVDGPLLERLMRAWSACYLHGRKRKVLLRLFRSLEMAFHASLFPADGLTSINDIGTRLALWVSAFEVLCHPGRGSVDKQHVQRLLSRPHYTWRTLTAKRYTISYKKERLRVTLPEALYDDIYWARNQFLHGMRVTSSMLHYRQSRAFSQLVQVAPVLYSAALVAHLDRINASREDSREAKELSGESIARYMIRQEGFRRVQRGIAAAAKPVALTRQRA